MTVFEKVMSDVAVCPKCQGEITTGTVTGIQDANCVGKYNLHYDICRACKVIIHTDGSTAPYNTRLVPDDLTIDDLDLVAVG